LVRLALTGNEPAPSTGELYWSAYDARVISDLEEAWNALHDALPKGWYVGRPSYHDERREWVQYAFDPSERAVVGVRSREWTAVASTEEGVVREMARCLRHIGRGEAPR